MKFFAYETLFLLSTVSTVFGIYIPRGYNVDDQLSKASDYRKGGGSGGNERYDGKVKQYDTTGYGGEYNGGGGGHGGNNAYGGGGGNGGYGGGHGENHGYGEGNGEKGGYGGGHGGDYVKSYDSVDYGSSGKGSGYDKGYDGKGEAGYYGTKDYNGDGGGRRHHNGHGDGERYDDDDYRKHKSHRNKGYGGDDNDEYGEKYDEDSRDNHKGSHRHHEDQESDSSLSTTSTEPAAETVEQPATDNSNPNLSGATDSTNAQPSTPNPLPQTDTATQALVQPQPNADACNDIDVNGNIGGTSGHGVICLGKQLKETVGGIKETVNGVLGMNNILG
ncbi:hypothetical protein K7432_004655 [Basidiobolus ranarum]|uniref:Uncharacterized protein n=1 Tax=Basidiobolus ranarum TaxID=34480 RepID=A0ABR2WXR0_9FUNG